ncbi:MAG TPA: hypothetical protein PLA85_08025 [Micropepsaceae bacterium]|nr:hypothetical protein [Micropepsaceae bacterium]
MSEQEKYAWLSLISLGGIYFFFQYRLTDSWAVAETLPSNVFWTYVAVVNLAIIAEIISTITLRAARGGKPLLIDERDHLIESKAGRNERLFMLAAINVLVFAALAQATFEGYSLFGLDLSRVPAILFWLLSTLFFGHFVKMISIIVAYRQ